VDAREKLTTRQAKWKWRYEKEDIDLSKIIIEFLYLSVIQSTNHRAGQQVYAENNKSLNYNNCNKILNWMW
jgi:hypothetical protein